MTEIAYNLYLTYTENDALDLFFKHYSIYYGFNNITPNEGIIKLNNENNYEVKIENQNE